MNYAEALKKAQSIKTSDCYWVIELSYDNKIVLPHKAGVGFIDSLAQAEVLKDRYSEQHGIAPVDRSAIAIRQMSRIEYEQYKIAGLLLLTIEEVRNMAEPKPEETTQ